MIDIKKCQVDWSVEEETVTLINVYPRRRSQQIMKFPAFWFLFGVCVYFICALPWWRTFFTVSESSQEEFPAGYCVHRLGWTQVWRVLPHRIYSRTLLYIANSMGDGEGWWLRVWPEVWVWSVFIQTVFAWLHVHRYHAVHDRGMSGKQSKYKNIFKYALKNYQFACRQIALYVV